MAGDYEEFKTKVRDIDFKLDKLKFIYAEYETKKNDFRMYVTFLRAHGSPDFSLFAIDELNRKWKIVKDYSALHRDEIADYVTLINDKSKIVSDQLDILEYSV